MEWNLNSPLDIQIDLLKQCANQCKEVFAQLKKNYEQVCVIGIGGSALGAQALLQALKPEALESNQFLFFDNADVKSFSRKLKQVKDPDKALCVTFF